MSKVVFQGDPGKSGSPGTPGLRVSRDFQEVFVHVQ